MGELFLSTIHIDKLKYDPKTKTFRGKYVDHIESSSLLYTKLDIVGKKKTVRFTLSKDRDFEGVGGWRREYKFVSLCKEYTAYITV